MGWSLGWSSQWDRDIGYGVPAYCDHPRCRAEIDRGLSYVCCDEEVGGGDYGCGLFFCSEHRKTYRAGHLMCSRCGHYKRPFTAKPDHPRWFYHKLHDYSWAEWRAENAEDVERMRVAVGDYIPPADDHDTNEIDLDVTHQGAETR